MSAAKKGNSGRFELVDVQTETVKGLIGIASITSVIVDKETGVNYLYVSLGGGALTPLLDKDGKVVITPNGKELV